MRWFFGIVCCVLVSGVGFARPAAAFMGPIPSQFATFSDSLPAPDSFTRNHRWLRTAMGIVVVNQTVWSYNRFIREGGTDEQFRVDWGSFSQNVSEGFVWDNNDFWTNHFYHPAHGSFYYEVARANGFDYWQSAAWTMLGSWHWEHAGEANTPSLNDLVNTTFGGIALGEPMFRLSGAVLDNQARGGERVWREIGGFLLAPGRGINRIMTGEAFQVHGRGPYQRPLTKVGSTELRMGYRSLGVATPAPAGTRLGFLEANVRYGNPFARADRSPFDHFDFDLLYNVRDDRHKIGKIKVAGLIGGAVRGRTTGPEHLFAVFQHFDYYDNPAYEFGSQSISASYMGRFPVISTLELRTTAHLKGVLLGATRADHAYISNRNYDYGMGLGYEVTVSVGGARRHHVAIGRGETVLRAIHGSSADHVVGFSTLQLRAPVLGFLSAGADFVRYDAHRNYRDFSAVYAHDTEVRAHLSWVFD